MKIWNNYRDDGWPLCNRCGQDELYSLAIPADPEKIDGCYVCGKCSGPFSDASDCPIHAPRYLAA